MKPVRQEQQQDQEVMVMVGGRTLVKRTRPEGGESSGDPERNQAGGVGGVVEVRMTQELQLLLHLLLMFLVWKGS